MQCEVIGGVPPKRARDLEGVRLRWRRLHHVPQLAPTQLNFKLWHIFNAVECGPLAHMDADEWAAMAARHFSEPCARLPDSVRLLRLRHRPELLDEYVVEGVLDQA